MFEMDGPGVTPKTVDTLQLLQLADACFRMAVKVAEASQMGITFQGLRVLDKCVAVAATPSSPKVARFSAAKVRRLVDGSEDAPSGAENLLRDVRRGLRGLRPHVTAGFRIGEVPYTFRSPDIPIAESPWERTELRVVPIRVGGRNLTAELASNSEAGTFIVETSLEVARVLGASLRNELDVVLDVCRDIDGAIQRGKIIEAFPLQDGDPQDVWKAWFAEAQEWDDIEDVGEALGRYN